MANHDHDLAMAALCRVCGNRCLKWEDARKLSPIKKEKFKDDLLKVYKIDVTADLQSIHPGHLCKSCISSFKRPSNKPVVEWGLHEDEDSCTACKLFSTKRRPGYGKVAAKRRQEHQAAAKLDGDVNAACDTILNSGALKSKKSPTRKLQLIASAVVKMLLALAATTFIQLPTGGPKLTLQKIAAPRIPTDQASVKTVRERSKQIANSIRAISCTGPNQSMAANQQLADVLRLKTPADLADFLHDNGLLKIRIPSGHELLMKVQLGWSWALMRKMKVWLKHYNIVMAAESVTRKARAHILGASQLVSEMLPFFFTENDEKITKLAPIVYVPDVVDHIMETLNQLDRYNLLQKEATGGRIWVKIGGDKGGGSTKMWYQIVNVKNPNSKFNTTVFAVFQADDSIANLHLALDRYITQINTLQNKTWQGLPIDVWLCGDFALDSRLLGLQGASATYPCTACHVRKDELDQEFDQEDANFEERTIESIKDDHQQVQTEGYSKAAKRTHHSVSHEPFFNIPIHQICPPVLHINLGLWNKFYNNLVADVQSLGEKIADKLAEENESGDVDPKDHFNFYVHNIREIKEEIHQLNQLAEDLRNEATELEYDLLTQSLLSPVEPSQEQMKTIQDLHEEAKQMDKNASQLRAQYQLREHKNPLVKRLESALEDFKVRRQAYHSRSFVGNHVAKCVQEKNYTALLKSIVDETRQLCPELEDLAVAIQMRHLLLFQQFSRCYKVYSASTTLSPQEIDQLETDINELVTIYKEKFPQRSVTPKFHFLWKHTIPFMRHTGFGLGLLSEQGGEQMHAEFNVLSRRFEGCKNIQGMSPEVYHLKKVMEEHLVRVHPSMRTHVLMNREE